jgi:hypothetical protein
MSTDEVRSVVCMPASQLSAKGGGCGATVNCQCSNVFLLFLEWDLKVAPVRTDGHGKGVLFEWS